MTRAEHAKGAKTKLHTKSLVGLAIFWGKYLPVPVPAPLDIGTVVAVGDSGRGQRSEFRYQQSVGGEESWIEEFSFLGSQTFC